MTVVCRGSFVVVAVVMIGRNRGVRARVFVCVYNMYVCVCVCVGGTYVGWDVKVVQKLVRKVVHLRVW